MSNDARSVLAKDVFDVSNIRGEFTLRSGAVSHEYFDKYLFEGQPELLKRISEAMVPMIPEGIDALAGLEMGGIPLAVMLSQVSALPTLFVRKEAKTYGTCKLAEGGEITGRRLLIIEDVVTSGGAVIGGVAALREQGAIVDTVLCVIDRESSGKEKLAEQGLTLHPLFTMTELKAHLPT